MLNMEIFTPRFHVLITKIEEFSQNVKFFFRPCDLWEIREKSSTGSFSEASLTHEERASDKD